MRCYKNKDGDETNIAFDNLYIEKRKNVMLKHFTPEQVEQIRKEYNKEEREKHGYRGIYANPPIMKCATSITAP